MIILARMAMATRFELVLNGDSPSLRAAGEEALEEILRVEGLLSLYRSTSEVAHLNARAASEAVAVSPEMFSLLERAVALGAETEGAFDVTIAPLVKCWGFMKGSGCAPTEEAIEEARAQVGFGMLELDRTRRTVRFQKAGMMLDFGAFGKGYAADCAAEILREAGVRSALLHGGTSTVIGIGEMEGGGGWKVAIEGRAEVEGKGIENCKLEIENWELKEGKGAPLYVVPPLGGGSGGNEASMAEPPEGGTTCAEVLAVVELRDESLGVSAVWGKSFAAEGKTFGHVLDGRTGRPTEGADLAAVGVASAAESDALSTALLVEGFKAIERLAERRPRARLLVLSGGKVVQRGL